MSSQYPIGKTIIELKMTTTNGLPFGSGASVVLTNPWTIQTILVPQNHVATICDGGDDYRFGFNGQEKVNEIAGTGNHYTALFWEYDPRTARRWNRDHVTHVGISDYSVLDNNPIFNTDPNGDDWYKDNNGSIKFNPKVQAQKDLNKGQKYLGDTYKEKQKGKVFYREDGSIKFSNETDAYNRMWTASKEPGGGTTTHEVMGAIVKDGVLVLPDYKNDATTSETKNVGYPLSNGKVYDPLTKTNIPLLATIHTHQVNFGDKGENDPPGLEDRNRLPFMTPNIPFLTMGRTGGVHAMMGDKTGVGHIQLPKGYNTVKDLLSGASLIKLFKANQNKR